MGTEIIHWFAQHCSCHYNYHFPLQKDEVTSYTSLVQKYCLIFQHGKLLNNLPTQFPGKDRKREWGRFRQNSGIQGNIQQIARTGQIEEIILKNHCCAYFQKIKIKLQLFYLLCCCWICLQNTNSRFPEFLLWRRGSLLWKRTKERKAAPLWVMQEVPFQGRFKDFLCLCPMNFNPMTSNRWT